MKFTSYLTLFAATLASVSAHSSMKNPLPRAHPLNPNAPTKDFACITAPFNGGAGCAPKPFPCGGYPVDTKITQVLSAGDVINVSFWNPNFPNGPSPSDAQADQARHNGGLCEFALSYDGGVTYTVIATYHQTCPDIFFDWKVKIPDNAPSCDNAGKCIFSWSWINAVGNREFYQNCADVKIQGNSTQPLPIKDITRVNLPPTFPTIDTPVGDSANTGNEKGSGPLQSDVSANLALTFDSGSSSPDATSPAPDTTSPAPDSTSPAPDSTSPAPDTTSPEPDSTSTAPDSTSTDTTSCKKRGKKGRKDCPPENSPSSSSSSSSSSSDGSCTNGEMKCADGGAFTTCVNGGLVTRKCPSGTVCMPSDGSIVCGRSARKF